MRRRSRLLGVCSRSSAISLMPARLAVGFIITMAEAGTAVADTSVTPAIGDETGDTDVAFADIDAFGYTGTRHPEP